MGGTPFVIEINNIRNDLRRQKGGRDLEIDAQGYLRLVATEGIRSLLPVWTH